VANVLSLTAAGVTATNTDAPALAEEIAVDCPEPRVAVVLGSGGAAQAAVVACRTLGVERIFVTSRSWQSSVARQQWGRAPVFEALGALATAWPLAGAVAPPPEQLLDGLLNADVVIQATTAGMLGAGPGQSVSEWLPWARMKPSALAYDLVYNPAVTPFLQEATRAGLCARGGLGMLVRQAALAIRLWLGETPDLAVLRSAAERALAGVGGS
jgi:shikimate dehydrogenase